MDAMAAGAVGGFDRTGFHGKPVIAVGEGFKSVLSQSVFTVDLSGSMAFPANLLGYVLRRDRGAGIGDGVNVVFTVAIGAGGGVRNPLFTGCAMDAPAIGYCNVAMASGACFYNFPLVRSGGRIASFSGIVQAMTLAATWSVLISRRKGLSVDALLIIPHESGGIAHLLADILSLQMALQAEFRLFLLCPNGFDIPNGNYFMWFVARSAAGVCVNALIESGCFMATLTGSRR